MLKFFGPTMLTRRSVFPAFLIVLLTVFVWHKLLTQAFLGEGYYYFDRTQDFINAQGRLTDIWQLDIFARILFDVLPPFFQDNIAAYFAFQLLTLIVLNLVFFYTVKFFTKNKWISFTASVLFLASYAGSFEMIAIGNYQRFAQRVPNLLVALVALIGLAKYHESKNIKFYFFSLLLFAASLFMSHFSTFLLPIFLIYPLVWALLQKDRARSFVRGVMIAASFGLVDLLIIKRGFHTPSINPIEFAKTNPGDITQQILLQLVSIIFPPALIDKIASVAQPYAATLTLLLIPVLLLLAWGLILARKEHVSLVVTYITSLLAIPVILFLNLYVGKVNAIFNIGGYKYYFLPSYWADQPDVITSVKGDRYYFVPSLFVAVVLAILIWLLFANRRKQNKKSPSAMYKIVTTVLLVVYTFYNSQIIWAKMDQLGPVSDAMKSYISYTRSISSRFNDNTTLVVPRAFLWPSPFVRTFYGHSDMQFLFSKPGWEKEIKPTQTRDVIVLTYDYMDKKFIDLTEEYRRRESPQ